MKISRIFFMLMAISLTLFLSVFTFAKTAPLPDNPKGEKKGLVESLSQKSTQAKEHFQKGLDFSRGGKIDLAIEEYRRVIELDPNSAMAYVNLGMSYIFKKDFATAVKELNIATIKDPSLKIAHFNLWWAYRGLQKYDLGLQELQKIIALDPNDGGVYKNIGDTYLTDKRMIPLAIQSYLKGLPHNQKDVSFHQKLGKAYELNKEWDKSVSHFQKAIELKKDDPYNYLFLYVAQKKAGNDSKAKETLDKALSNLKKNLSRGSFSFETIPIFEYLAGSYSEEKVLATKNPIIAGQANYYIAMKYLFEKKPDKAAIFFQKIIDQNLYDVSEYEYAKIELDEILKKPSSPVK